MGIFQQFPYTNFHEMNLDQIIKIMREMQDEWEATKAEWASYKDYIDNYFANLDVSDEILQALQVLIADGTFNDVVDPVITAYTAQWLADNITPSTPVVDASLSVRGAAADAEVTGEYIAQVTDAHNKFMDDMTMLLGKGHFQRGVYNPSTGVTSALSYRIGSRTDISFDTPVRLTIEDGFRLLPYVFSNNSWAQGAWRTGSYDLNPAYKYQFQIARVTEDPDEVADYSEFLSAITMSYTYTDIVINNTLGNVDTVIHLDADDYIPIEYEEGGYLITDGVLIKQANNARLRSKKIYKVCKGQKFLTSALTLVQFNITVVDALTNGTSIGTSGWTSIDTTQTEKVYEVPGDGYAYVSCKRSDNGTISLADLTTDNCYSYLTNNFPYNIPQRARHIYHFGGEGVDWCFVYTPDNYDPHRVQPYPFVVCNHGNGWMMNGHPSGANWTKRTMYVPFSDPDYINDPSNYNGTDNPRLYYSNPTIELFRTNGYVVCGCENYDDFLFGNDDCRNACVEFINHMIKHYNVESRCYMIGASNGALTSLNANYLAQGQIKAMILQYPITCLLNQYMTQPTHRAQIQTAYNIPATATLAEVQEAIKTHDPLSTDVVDSKKVGAVAPTKIWASPDDTVVDINENAIPYKNMVEVTKVCELVTVTGEHGNYTHFDPAAFLAWFDEH